MVLNAIHFLKMLLKDAVESDEEVITGWDGGLYAYDDPRAIKE